MSALSAEICLKKRYLGRCRVDVIYVGGGTPSVLSPAQIEALGQCIEENFDITNLREFTFEVEVKSADRSKLGAMSSIGVNRISFGAQTFSDYYRKLFSLDANICQIFEVAADVNSEFAYTNVDLLYGFAGQSIDQLEYDLENMVSLKTTTIDVYPINNFAAPRSMQSAMARERLSFLPATERLQFRLFINCYLRERGYEPINGYSFARSERADLPSIYPVKHSPKFLYHDLVYGFDTDEILGYGSSAITRIPGFNSFNDDNRRQYVTELLDHARLPQQAFGPINSPERGIVYFPYRGILEKSAVAWDKVTDEVKMALQSATDAGLVFDCGDSYVLTETGWLFYVNLMYYLMPASSKEVLSRRIDQQEANGWRCGSTDLSELIRLDAEETRFPELHEFHQRIQSIRDQRNLHSLVTALG
jgi:oxygen-independent coproporphyrinogen-3 oxidase